MCLVFCFLTLSLLTLLSIIYQYQRGYNQALLLEGEVEVCPEAGLDIPLLHLRFRTHSHSYLKREYGRAQGEQERKWAPPVREEEPYFSQEEDYSLQEDQAVLVVLSAEEELRRTV